MKLWVKAIVSFGLLALLLSVLPWTDLREAVARLPAAVWFPVLGLFLLGHAAGIMKWRLMVNAGRARLGRVDAARCYSAGLFANLCLPSIVGGDVLRATLAARATRRPEAVVLGGIADRIIDVAALGVLVVTGGFLARDALPGWSGALLTGVLVLGVLVAAVTLPIVVRRPLARWPARFRRRAGRTLAGLRRLARNPLLALTAALVALAMQAGFVLLNAWIGRSIGIDVPLIVWFLVWPLAKIAGLLPVSLGGLGVRDATLGALLAPAGVPVAYGVVASLIWQTVVIAGGLIAGATWWVLGRRRGSPSVEEEANAYVPAPREYV